MEKKEAAIETIFVIPKNQFYIGYRLNEGIMHTIKKDRAFKYFKDFISQKNYIQLADLLSRFLPLLIMVKEDKIIELKKDDDTSNLHHHEKLEKEIKSATSTGLKIDRKKEYISNDKELEKIYKINLK